MDLLQPNLEDNKQLNEKGGSIKKSLDIQAVESSIKHPSVPEDISDEESATGNKAGEQPSSTSQLASIQDQHLAAGGLPQPHQEQL